MLTVIGICGVVSYTVAQQTREIGIRMALGAPRFTVLRNVLHDAGKLVVIGTATGTAPRSPAGPRSSPQDGGTSRAARQPARRPAAS